jgi:hypothetical protein
MAPMPDAVERGDAILVAGDGLATYGAGRERRRLSASTISGKRSVTSLPGQFHPFAILARFCGQAQPNEFGREETRHCGNRLGDMRRTWPKDKFNGDKMRMGKKSPAETGLKGCGQRAISIPQLSPNSQSGALVSPGKPRAA